MNLAIFPTLEAAQAFIAAVNAAMGWPDSAGTLTYADPISLLDGTCAVPVEPFATPHLPPGTNTVTLSAAELSALQPPSQ